jgi:hypothetical protein
VKRISIDLSEPLERVLTQALALPTGSGGGRISEARVKEAVSRLYAAAHGRTVATPLGHIPIAPAVAPWLKAAPLAVRTRTELLTLAGMSSDGNGSGDASEVAPS